MVFVIFALFAPKVTAKGDGSFIFSLIFLGSLYTGGAVSVGASFLLSCFLSPLFESIGGNKGFVLNFNFPVYKASFIEKLLNCLSGWVISLLTKCS